jgi:hypothetical protein
VLIGLSQLSTEIDTAQFLAIMASVLDVFDEASMYWVVLAGFPADVWKVARTGEAAKVP